MQILTHISPCPNDTFMFDALLNGKMNIDQPAFRTSFLDIERLNNDALRGIPDLTKVSYAVVPHIAEEYQLLTAGGALGRGNGPLLVSKHHLPKNGLFGLKIGIPGKLTTANLLLQRLFPEIGTKVEYLFSDISRAVLQEEVDAGVLIHEGRFVCQDMDLKLVADLGLEWELRYGLPLPLGAIAVRRSLPEKTKMTLNNLVRSSVQYALEHPAGTYEFVKKYAQEMNKGIIEDHIKLFVNHFSLDLEEEGKRSVEKLLDGSLDRNQYDSLFVG